MTIALLSPWASKPPTHAARLRKELGPQAFMHLLNGNMVTTGVFYRHGTWVAGSYPSHLGLDCDGSTWYEAAGASDWPGIAPQNDGEFTCVLVCYPTGMGTDVGRFACGNGASAADKGWFFGYENRVAASSPNAMRFSVFSGGATRVDARQNVSYLTDQCRMMAVVSCGASGVRMAVNGTGAVYSWANVATSGSATRNLHVGRPNYSSTVVPFVGLIESVAFINKSFPLGWVTRASLDPYSMLLEPDSFVIPHSAATVPTLSAAFGRKAKSIGLGVM